MSADMINRYLTSTVKTPYFLFVGDGKYNCTLEELLVLGLDILPISSFCSEDKLPNLDEFLSYIESADINANGKKFIVTGLGEYLALRGKDEATRTLYRMKDFNVGGAKVVLLLRGLSALIPELQTDLRFDDRRYMVIDNAVSDLSFTVVPQTLDLSGLIGFKTMLAELEKGRCGSIIVSTAVNLDKALFTVHKIGNAYEGIKLTCRGFALARSCGNDYQWEELLRELNRNNGLLDTVFKNYGFGGNIEADFYNSISGERFYSWLFFIYLKINAESCNNSYLRFVLDIASGFEEFAGNILNAIIEIKHTDSRFDVFYNERKALVDKYPESDIASFVVNNRQVIAESIYKLTDNTRVEREEIIAWLSKHGLIPQLETIYPVLAAYLKHYVFRCPVLADLLTDYFVAYKRQKLSNQLEPEFLKKVDELALSRQFNRLTTRDEIMDSVDKNETYLYWLDALGVEYLGLIENLVQRRGLSVRIEIARAELPTITSVNKGFYDAWQGRKEKNSELDDTKHKDVGGYNFSDNELPIHLAKELEVIVEMIDKASTALALRQCKRFLIVSDHGASRLAVIRRKEEKYDTDTSGEHSGRCCKLFRPYDLPFAAEENGYLVLADYGRFKGSRAANVEVHGGATLEEVIVPIIELSLKDVSVTVKLVNETVTVDYQTGTEVTLFFNTPATNISAVINGKAYSAVQLDENHFSVELSDIKRAGEYPADVYAGDNLIGKVTIKTIGKSGKVNDDFDELF